MPGPDGHSAAGGKSNGKPIDCPAEWFINICDLGSLAPERVFEFSTVSTNVGEYTLSAAAMPYGDLAAALYCGDMLAMVWWGDLAINGFAAVVPFEAELFFNGSLQLQDLTGDGMPELIIFRASAGNGWCTCYYRIWEIQTLGLREITPSLPGLLRGRGRTVRSSRLLVTVGMVALRGLAPQRRGAVEARDLCGRRTPEA